MYGLEGVRMESSRYPPRYDELVMLVVSSVLKIQFMNLYNILGGREERKE
jgi:hypothetical protein